MGIKGGPNWTNVQSANFLEQTDNRNGFNLGLSYDYLLSKRFFLGADALYVQKGFTNDIVFTDEQGNPTGERYPIIFNYDYLSIPFRGGIRVGNKVSGFANLGIIPSILVNATSIDPALPNLTEEVRHDVTSRVTRVDIGGLIEVGANYSILSQLQVSASLAYHHSFNSITNEEYFQRSDVRHMSMLLSLGVKYALKKD